MGRKWEEKYWDCVQDTRITKRTIRLKDIVRLIIKSAAETGTPFVFNRDIVNRANPNPHRGMIILFEPVYRNRTEYVWYF